MPGPQPWPGVHGAPTEGIAALARKGAPLAPSGWAPSSRFEEADGRAEVPDMLRTRPRALPDCRPLWFDPVLCPDPTGTVLKLLRVDDLASAARKSR